MNKRPLVSVITPVYNAEKYIGETIESILNQTYENFEFIIVDDASTDNTWEILKEYEEKDSRIKLFKNKKNLYIAGNRNKGLEKAKGKYIVWQDADDISVSTRLEKQVEFMEDHPEVGICGGYLQSFMGNKDLDIRTYPTGDKELRENIFKFSPVAQPAAIIRKEAFEKVGKYDLDKPPAEDIDMTFRIGEHYKFANLPEVLIRYREHSDSATHQNLSKQIKSTLETRKEYSDGHGYEMSLSDKLAYYLAWGMQIFPARFTINVFKVLRNFVNIFSKKGKRK